MKEIGSFIDKGALDISSANKIAILVKNRLMLFKKHQHVDALVLENNEDRWLLNEDRMNPFSMEMLNPSWEGRSFTADMQGCLTSEGVKIISGMVYFIPAEGVKRKGVSTNISVYKIREDDEMALIFTNAEEKRLWNASLKERKEYDENIEYESRSAALERRAKWSGAARS